MIHPHKKIPTMVRILKMSRGMVGSVKYIIPSLEKQVKGVSTPPPIWYWVACRKKHMDVQPLKTINSTDSKTRHTAARVNFPTIRSIRTKT